MFNLIQKDIFHDEWGTTISDLGIPKFTLVHADPPYNLRQNKDWDNNPNLVNDLVELFDYVEEGVVPGGSFYLWGGFGEPLNRVFYETILEVERQTNWRMSSHITWSKRRAYGIDWRFLPTREELAHFVLGDIKKPAVFNVPYLDELRGYEGWDKKHPCKDARKRRTMVWTDINEKFKDLPHPQYKPKRLCEVILETSSNPGDYVLDLFSGCGEFSKTALALGRSSIAIENDPKWCEYIKNYINNPSIYDKLRDDLSVADMANMKYQMDLNDHPRC